MRHVTIDVAMIDPNPHRDFQCNPLDEGQITSIVNSISMTGFWDNIVVRPHPKISTRYQLAYGHSRLEAARRCGIKQVTLPVADLTDTQMFFQMVLENETQTTITAPVVFENIRAATRHLESLFRKIGESGTYTDFCKETGEAVPRGTTSSPGRAFEQVRDAFWKGEGIGCKFIQEFIPSKRIHVTVINEVLSSFYGLQRSKAKKEQAEVEQKNADKLKRRAEDAKEQRRHADSERREAEQRVRESELKEKNEEIKMRTRFEAERAAREANQAKEREEEQHKKAEESQRKAERLRAESIKDGSGHIDEEVLKSLPSPTHIREFASAIKGFKIPKEHHQEIATMIINQGIPVRDVRTKINLFWDERSGTRTKREVEDRKRRRLRKLYKDTCGGDYEKFLHAFAEDISRFLMSVNIINGYVDKALPPARYYPKTSHCIKFAERLDKMTARCQEVMDKAVQLSADLKSTRLTDGSLLNGNGEPMKALPEIKS